ncbi:MAG: gamma-glutamyl-gamma-aminobutyrate hydrolase family protein [Gammaproteobacteria bacterium]|nr:gamma-glutamyl-gamma-aminobutyrate hydrolase family protein [Gammaproteobacteria bacterium]
MLIATTQRTEKHVKYNETRDALDKRWSDFLNACQLTPLLVPNHFKSAQKLVEDVLFQGVLLTGGNASPCRIEVEILLLEFAIQENLPVFGVCHGMQFIQQYFGLKLFEVSGHIEEKLEIMINGKVEEVNSYHDYGTNQTTEDLLVWAKSKDGVIKAIKHCYLPIVGIMWHPERCVSFKLRDIQLIQNFFSGALDKCEQLY